LITEMLIALTQLADR